MANLIKVSNRYVYQKLEREDTSTGRVYKSEKIGHMPSVTTILSATKDKASLEAWAARVGAEEAERIKRDAAHVGTAMHQVMESFIAGEPLPVAEDWLQMRGYEMGDGSSIEVKAFYSASISEARRAEAFEWLRNNNFGDLIKNTVSVRFGRGEEQLCQRAMEMLSMSGFPVEQAEKVEPMTLKAWVKERVEKGSDFPSELFGVYIGQKATIKSV